MPPFLSVIRSCDRNMREYLFRELSQIISIIKLHARNYMKEIFAIIKVCTVCTVKFKALVIIMLLDECNIALQGEPECARAIAEDVACKNHRVRNSVDPARSLSNEDAFPPCRPQAWQWKKTLLMNNNKVRIYRRYRHN